MTVRQVQKRSGDVEPYRERKLRAALRRIGLSGRESRAVVHDVDQILEGEVPTSAIDKVVRRALRRAPAPCAARWNLRRALLDLGPSGFPFERFVAELFAASGFRTKVGERLMGRFIRHEVDVVAERGDQRVLCECKLVTRRDGKIDAKTAMYVYGRAADLDALSGSTRQWLVTNGRFTIDARRFGEGMGLRLLGWDAPAEGGLRDLIENVGVMPVTALGSLPTQAKTALLTRGHVLCRDLVRSPRILDSLGLPATVVRRALEEARAVMHCMAAR